MVNILIKIIIFLYCRFHYILFLYILEKRGLAYELISTEQDTDVLQILDDNVENNICNDEVVLSIGIYHFCYLLA